ncbi:MAG: 4a-hydroxytetrahydrobiopterin dehydratase [Phycisphaerales bacterium]|nr:4a-hydroxytetrahydrobiopterin dehydratase [Phycisphaerae bacterium]NNF44435.1 4a-hydroxytetrahydrobiopterin dehydratase [Phycisphaerales bacterium]NNM26210.1 4a-hydroxytetrahydrobiopterin dehydratase [Phycisphaerales bacterium]
MTKLSTEDIEARIGAFPDWARNGEALVCTFSFEDFVNAMGFVSRVADLAEEHQHHPDIMIRYNKVTLTLSTHDAGGLTEKDFALARDIDAFATASKG